LSLLLQAVELPFGGGLWGLRGKGPVITHSHVSERAPTKAILAP